MDNGFQHKTQDRLTKVEKNITTQDVPVAHKDVSSAVPHVKK